MRYSYFCSIENAFRYLSSAGWDLSMNNESLRWVMNRVCHRWRQNMITFVLEDSLNYITLIWMRYHKDGIIITPNPTKVMKKWNVLFRNFLDENFVLWENEKSILFFRVEIPRNIPPRWKMIHFNWVRESLNDTREKCNYRVFFSSCFSVFTWKSCEIRRKNLSWIPWNIWWIRLKRMSLLKRSYDDDCESLQSSLKRGSLEWWDFSHFKKHFGKRKIFFFLRRKIVKKINLLVQLQVKNCFFKENVTRFNVKPDQWQQWIAEWHHNMFTDL